MCKGIGTIETPRMSNKPNYPTKCRSCNGTGILNPNKSVTSYCMDNVAIMAILGVFIIIAYAFLSG